MKLCVHPCRLAIVKGPKLTLNSGNVLTIYSTFHVFFPMLYLPICIIMLKILNLCCNNSGYTMYILVGYYTVQYGNNCYFRPIKTDTLPSSKTLVCFYWTAWHNIAETCIFQPLLCESQLTHAFFCSIYCSAFNFASFCFCC